MHSPCVRIAALLLLLACVGAEDKWSWGAKDKASGASSDDVTATKASLVDDIIASGRQGRNLQGYDEVYADPGVQDVLKGSNETHARHLIRDRLCDLGLGSVSTSHLYWKSIIADSRVFYPNKT